MNRRQFVIPAVSALGLSMTAACTDPLVGEWEGATLSYGGVTVDLPYTSTSTYNGHTYSYYTALHITVLKDLTGTLKQTYIYTYDGASNPAQVYQYALSATKSASKTYDISVPTEQLALSCSVAKTVLSCSETGGSTVTFDKQ
jgi:hypothetical protein